MKPRVEEGDGRSAETSIERLLWAAAEFEPETAAPGVLSSGGILMLLAEDAQRRRRRTIQARVAALTGVMAGAAACSASLVMALTQPSRPGVEGAPSQASVQPSPAATFQDVTTPKRIPSPPPRLAAELPRRTVRRRRPAQVHLATKPESAAPSVWTEQTVEHRMTGVFADAWIVQPQADGTLELAPAIIDLPMQPMTTLDACGPTVEQAPLEISNTQDIPTQPSDESK